MPRPCLPGWFYILSNWQLTLTNTLLSNNYKSRFFFFRTSTSIWIQTKSFIRNNKEEFYSPLDKSCIANGVYDGYSATPAPALRKGKDHLFPIHTESNSVLSTKCFWVDADTNMVDNNPLSFWFCLPADCARPHRLREFSQLQTLATIYFWWTLCKPEFHGGFLSLTNSVRWLTELREIHVRIDNILKNHHEGC